MTRGRHDAELAAITLVLLVVGVAGAFAQIDGFFGGGRLGRYVPIAAEHRLRRALHVRAAPLRTGDRRTSASRFPGRTTIRSASSTS